MVERCLREYGYLQKFIDKYEKTKAKKVEYVMVKRKPLFLGLGFNSDEVAEKNWFST